MQIMSKQNVLHVKGGVQTLDPIWSFEPTTIRPNKIVATNISLPPLLSFGYSLYPFFFFYKSLAFSPPLSPSIYLPRVLEANFPTQHRLF